jgi:hypothetical protein
MPAAWNVRERMEGLVTKCETRKTGRSTSFQIYTIGGRKFSLFTDEATAFLKRGDYVRFDYEPQRGSKKKKYFSIVDETLELVSPDNGSDGGVGFVYVLVNASMPGLCKIGFTLICPTDRAAEISANTGVPTAFELAWSVSISGDARKVEQSVHAALQPHRAGKEFFRVSVERAKQVVLTRYATLYPNVETGKGDVLAKRLREREERRTARREQVAREALERSPEYQWRKSGFTVVTLEESAPKPERGFWSRLFGGPPVPEDWMAGYVAATKSNHAWSVALSGRKNGQPFSTTTESLPTLEEAQERLGQLIDQYDTGIRNVRIVYRISNDLLNNPIIPSGQQPRRDGDTYELHLKGLDSLKLVFAELGPAAGES